MIAKKKANDWVIHIMAAIAEF